MWLAYWLGFNLSVAVAVGFIALAGLAAQTGVVMLLYLDHALSAARERARAEGRALSLTDLRQAVIDGAVERLRPKIMTVAAIMAGLLPLMWSTGTGSEVMRRIAAVMPVTPVPLAATALLDHGGDLVSRADWESRLDELRARLRDARAPVLGDEKTSGEILDRALVMFTLRRVVAPDGGSFRVDRSQEALLRYYANSIAHFFETRTQPS